MERKNVTMTMTPVEDMLANEYVLDIACSLDDGMAAMDNVEIESENMDDLTILMLAYLNMYNDIIPVKWYDAFDENTRKDIDGDIFGGRRVNMNKRFDTADNEDWLIKFAERNGFMLYDTAYTGDLCDNILDISIEYYNENGTVFDCKLPDLGELFETEQDFINYVHMLENGQI